MEKTVWFVCSANMYRSRLAEILFNHYAHQENLPWKAESRALARSSGSRGISPMIKPYLEAIGLEKAFPEAPRDPISLTLEEFTDADLVIGMCRGEHESGILQRYGALAQKKIEEKRLLFWNVYDSSFRGGKILRFLAWIERYPTQPYVSGREHIHWGVQTLVQSLK